MAYKSLSVVQQKLNTAEERYNRQKFGTMREEQLQVNEINRLKRNLAKLTKYLPLVDERKTLDDGIKTSRQNLRVRSAAKPLEIISRFSENSLENARALGPASGCEVENHRSSTVICTAT